VKLRLHIVLPLVILLAGLYLRVVDTPILAEMRLKVFDTMLRLQPREYDPDLPVRIVDIDNESLERLGQWPWPRTLVAELVLRLTEAGADGFIFEPFVDFGMMAERFGQSHCLVGSFVDCRDLTFRNEERVKEDVERTFTALENCRGAILAVGNHLPPNIPPEMLDLYYGRLLPRLAKGAE